MTSYQPQLKLALSAAVAAGGILQSYVDETGRSVVHRKESFRDIATEVDTYAEQKIINILNASSDIPVVAEESGMSRKVDLATGTYWIVDPLDGTVNYVSRIPFCAVSIAYVDEGKPVVGVVYNPFQNELYYGGDGLGVYKNHTRIASLNLPAGQVLCAGTFSGANHPDRDAEFNAFQKINDATMGCLRTGSASLNLTYVAEGRLGGCFGRHTKWWDIAAGLVLARLAGADVVYTVADPLTHSVHYVVANQMVSSLIRNILDI